MMMQVGRRFMLGLLFSCWGIACTQDGLSSVCPEEGCDPAEPSDVDEPLCGNGRIDSGERCDPGIESGLGACVCPEPPPCFEVELVGEGCVVNCVESALIDAISGDGCCPSGKVFSEDSDCEEPVIEEPAEEDCGNGVLDDNEDCDLGIAAGQPGACPQSCSSSACSDATLVGEGCARRCDFSIYAVANADGCCLGPEFAGLDSDCPTLSMCIEDSQPFAAKKAWEWDDAPFALRTTASTSVTPIVAQFTDDNGDGQINTEDMPDVLVLMNGIASFLEEVNDLSAIVTVLSGDSGDSHWTKVMDDYRVSPFATPAVGDIDGDGRVEIVFVTHIEGGLPADGLVAFEHDGTFKWYSDPFEAPLLLSDAVGAVSLADLEGDGSVEIIMGNRVYGPNGQLRWAGAHVNFPEYAGRISYAVELGGAPGREIIDGHTAYSADGSIHFDYPSLGHGFSAVADCEGDGTPEIFMYSVPQEGEFVSSVVVLNADGSVRAGPSIATGFALRSPPASGDVDGDGEPEFVVATPGRLVALNCDLSVAMNSDFVTDISGAASPAVFDFDGDGQTEIVYADELKIRVISGDGSILWDTQRLSVTGLESPAIADIDNDGEAELIVPQSRQVGALPLPAGVIVYESDGMPWSSAMSIWNQHAFRGLNIFEDGTLPAVEGPWWNWFNGFRGAPALAGPESSCADL